MMTTVPLSWMQMILQYAVMSHRVKDSYGDRGGIMLVAGPGQLKTTLLRAFEYQLGVMAYSDINTTQLIELKGQITSKKVNTIVLYDVNKLYERHRSVTANLIGNLRALMSEGFSTANLDRTSHSMVSRVARALVLMAATDDCYQRNYGDWFHDGFARRVLFLNYVLDDPSALANAAVKDIPIEIPSCYKEVPVNFSLPGKLGAKEEQWLMKLSGQTAGESIPLILMRRIFILAQHFNRLDRKEPRASDLIETIVEANRKEGIELWIPDEIKMALARPAPTDTDTLKASKKRPANLDSPREVN